MGELAKMAIDFLKTKIGATNLLLIAMVALGAYGATKAESYIVMPDTLDKAKKEIYLKMDKTTARLELKTIEMELSSLRKEKYDLEDLIDIPKPKRRNVERLDEVKVRIKELDGDKKELLKILESK